MLIVMIVNLGITFLLALMLHDQYHKDREVLLRPGEIDEKILKPDDIDPNSIIAHAYKFVTLTNGFTPDDIEERFELAYPLMTPNYARDNEIENIALFDTIKTEYVYHNFRVVNFPKKPIELTAGSFWSVTFIGRLDVTTGKEKGLRDPTEVKIVEIYIERRDDTRGGGKGLFVSDMIPYSWEEYVSLQSEMGISDFNDKFIGIKYDISKKEKKND